MTTSDAVVPAMTPPGRLMLDLSGTDLSGEEARLLRHPGVGGVILFSRNFSSPQQLQDLVASIRACRPRVLIAVDQEGGRVQRFREGFTRLPPLRWLGHGYARAPDRARALARSAGWLMAAEVRACGVDFSFAPVLDVDAGISSVIGDRAFADDAGAISELAEAYIDGMAQAGMAATGKHFPGHGFVAADSHLALPVDERSLEEIRSIDMSPYRHLIPGRLQGVMPAHVVYSRLDEQPAGFSPFWIQRILRQELGFTGVIFSDDLTMAGAAVAGSYPQRGQAALDAGCDMILVCNNADGAQEVLAALGDRLAAAPGNPLESMAGKPGPDWQTLVVSEQWRSARANLQELAALAGESLGNGAGEGTPS